MNAIAIPAEMVAHALISTTTTHANVLQDTQESTVKQVRFKKSSHKVEKIIRCNVDDVE